MDATGYVLGWLRLHPGLTKLATVLVETGQLLQVILTQRVPLPTGTWTFTFKGSKITGRAPMPVSILDTDQGWGVSVGDLKDSLGEPAAAGATVALAVGDATLVALTDNGGGAGTFGSALAAGATTPLPASTDITATVTNPDGTSFSLTDTITVVASDAVTGAFTFTAPAPTPAP